MESQPPDGFAAPQNHNDPSSSEPAEPASGTRAAATAKKHGRVRRFWQWLGPGVIAGASDDDPATIGTCASIGASTGYATLWAMLFAIPLMCAVQYTSAKVGLVTGQGLAKILRTHYPRWLLYPVVVGLFIGNTINAGADLGAVAASIHMLAPVVPLQACVPVIAAVIVALQFWGNYRLIERVFKLLALSLVAYIGAGVLSRPDVGEVLWNTFVPHIELNRTFLAALVAISGTTFPPYLYFWQADQEAEEKKARRGSPAPRRGATEEELKTTAVDVNIGMIASNVVTYFIIMATAATLFTHGIYEVGTADEAARALQPFAGSLSKWLLALGLIAAGLLAIPVLTTSAAYALSQAFGWKYGLDAPPERAPQFYVVIVLSTVIGISLNYLGIQPFTALFVTSVIYGFLCPPLLLVLMLVSRNAKVMHGQTSAWFVRVLGWTTTVAAFAAVVGLVVLWLEG